MSIEFAQKLERENFALAAHQCRHPYGDEHGHPRCRTQDENAELLAALKDIATDRDIDMIGSYADGFYDALGILRNIALAAIAKAESHAP